MKNRLIAIALIIGFTVNAQEIHFQEFTTIDKALAQSKKENKLLFFDTWAIWCGWCTFMEDNIFNDPEIITYFNENFIAFKVDADADHAINFMAEYEISGLPALLILDEKGTIINRSDGAITEIDEFLNFGKLAYYKKNPKTSPWYKNEQKFIAGQRDYLFLKDYALSMLKGEFNFEDIKPINDLYWENSPDKSLNDTSNFFMFYTFIHAFDSQFTKIFIQNKQELIEIHGEDTYYTKGISLIQENLDYAVENNNKARYTETVSFTKQVFSNQNIVELDALLTTIDEIWKDR